MGWTTRSPEARRPSNRRAETGYLSRHPPSRTARNCSRVSRNPRPGRGAGPLHPGLQCRSAPREAGILIPGTTLRLDTESRRVPCSRSLVPGGRDRVRRLQYLLPGPGLGKTLHPAQAHSKLRTDFLPSHIIVRISRSWKPSCLAELLTSRVTKPYAIWTPNLHSATVAQYVPNFTPCALALTTAHPLTHPSSCRCALRLVLFRVGVRSPLHCTHFFFSCQCALSFARLLCTPSAPHSHWHTATGRSCGHPLSL